MLLCPRKGQGQDLDRAIPVADPDLLAGGGESPQLFSSPPIFANERRRREIWVPTVERPEARSAVGRSGGWVREGVAPSREGGSGVSPPRKFLKIYIHFGAFWCILAL